MTGHPGADVLAGYREGLTGRYRSARIRAHLARCPRCASLDDGLAEVTALLAGAPVPKIPDELAARLDGVLAAESAARARAETPAAASQTPAAASQTPVTAGEPAGAAPAPGPGSRRDRRPERPRSARPPRPRHVTALRAASVTAVLLVLAGGGYGVSRLLQTGGSGATSSSAGPAESPPRRGSGAHGPAQGPGGSGGPGVQPASRVPAGGVPAGGVPVVRSGTDYQPGRLAAQAEQALARYRAGSAGGTPTFATRLGSTMAPCVKLVTGGARPSLVDVARYRGRPATVIVRAAAGAQPGQVWVVGSGCSATSRDLIAHAPLQGSG